MNESEKVVAHQILSKGFKQVVDTFSDISQHEVLINSLDIQQVEGVCTQGLKLEKAGKIFLLTTEVVGDVAAKSYLSFEAAEVDALVRMCLPSLDPNNQDKNMAHAMLLELDNMLSANVVTHIANSLGVKIFGDVPTLQETTAQQVIEEVAQAFSTPANDQQAQKFLLVKVEFSMTNRANFQPVFIWKFTHQFFQAISDYVKQAAL